MYASLRGGRRTSTYIVLFIVVVIIIFFDSSQRIAYPTRRISPIPTAAAEYN